MSELSVGQLKGLTVNSNTITVPSGHSLAVPTLKGDTNNSITIPDGQSLAVPILKGDSGGTITVPSGQKLYAPGTIVQVQTTQTATHMSYAVQDITAISGLGITFTPKFASSKLLLTSTVTGSSGYVCTYGFIKDGSYLSSVNNSNSSGSVYTSYYNDGFTDGGMRPATFSFSYSPGSTAAATYYVGVSSSWAGSIYTTYINDRSGGDMRSYSSFTIMEIAQ